MNEIKLNTTILLDSFLDRSQWFYGNAGSADGSWGTIIEAWEPTKLAIETHTPERRVMISAGAHVGLYIQGYANLFNMVYAFEPDPLHFYCLVNNVQDCNVVKMQAALGETPVFGSMVGHSMSARVDEDLIAHPFIPILPIDAFQFPVVDVIQLDIEGYELRALKGAIRTITSCKPLLIIENGHFEEIVDFLAPLGYTIVERLHWDTVWKWKGNEPQI